MTGIVETLRSYVTRRRYRFRFRVRGRERHCRHEFFYNAFRALSFNGIDGDYAEFGCYRAMTFAMAYHEAVRHKHKARLWAFDSFSGSKMNHQPLTLLKSPQSPSWTRIDGLASGTDLAREVTARLLN